MSNILDMVDKRTLEAKDRFIEAIKSKDAYWLHRYFPRDAIKEEERKYGYVRGD